MWSQGYFWWGPPCLLFLSAGERRGGSSTWGAGLSFLQLASDESLFCSSSSVQALLTTPADLSITTRQVFALLDVKWRVQRTKKRLDISWITSEFVWTVWEAVRWKRALPTKVGNADGVKMWAAANSIQFLSNVGSSRCCLKTVNGGKVPAQVL